MASKRCSCAPDELCNLCANDYFNGGKAWAPECYYVSNLIVDDKDAPHFDYREPYHADAPL